MDFSILPLDGFAPKDKKIIKDNPGKTAMELAALALSDKAYARLGELQEQHEAEIMKQLKEQSEAAKVEPVRVQATVVKPAQPRLTNNHVGPTSVWLYNSNTGLRQNLSRSAADKLVRMNPNVYKIVG